MLSTIIPQHLVDFDASRSTIVVKAAGRSKRLEHKLQQKAYGIAVRLLTCIFEEKQKKSSEIRESEQFVFVLNK